MLKERNSIPDAVWIPSKFSQFRKNEETAEFSLNT